MLVRVLDFVFLVNFIFLDMPEDATGRTLIDVKSGDLTFQVNNEELKIFIYGSMRIPDDGGEENFVHDPP